MATTLQPVTEEMLTEDRQHFFHGFMAFATMVTTAVVILLILMAYFLT